MEENNKEYWLEKGTVLAGKYRIEDVIGEGGFGIVYLGYDIVLNMEIAIKEYFPRKSAIREHGTTNLYIYKGELEDTFQKGLQKFYDEAKLQAQFYGIEGIATVRDFFYENRTAYIINDYIPGVNVRTEVSMNGRMEQERVLQLMHPILCSLKAIHEKGLLHRDISPDNIILQGDQAVLVDFGAARLANIQDDRSITVLFKRGYSAEEQYIRNGKQGPYTDVYAVCATMYYMLTGVEPEEAVSRRIKDHVVPLKRYKEIEIDAGVGEAIMKGMSVAVKNRYSNMETLYDALYGKRLRYRKRWVASALLAVICLGVMLWTAGTLQRQRGGAHRETVSPAADRSFVGVADSLSENKKSAGENQPLDGDANASSAEELTVAEKSATDEPRHVWQMPDVTGLRQKAAVKKIKKTAPADIKIHIKKVYHAEAAGRVVGQSLKAGKEYQQGEVKKITLRVSQGAKPKASPTPDRSGDGSAGNGQTAPPAATKASGNSGSEGAGQRKKEEGFAGALPW